MPKILFLDLDGTLLNSAKQISPTDRSALGKALAQGHRIVITTGRTLPSALEQAELLGLSGPGCYLLAYNGGVLYDLGDGKLLEQRTLPIPLVQEILSLCESMDIHVQTYDQTHVLVTPRWEDATLRRYCETVRTKYRVVTSITEEPAKVLAGSYDHPECLIPLEHLLKEHLGSRADCFFTCEYYLEVVPHGVSKGNALVALCSRLGIPVADSIAVGDAENDVSMIRAAGIGVAMANAIAEAKAAADYVTQRDNDHSGVAELVHRFMCP